jgi:NAD(P)-dependent dehydrogenase (short-subunit alcohol dehydrogenase family)
MRLEGRVALITGAGRGIGLATAELFAREGAKVAVVSRTKDEVERTAEAINARGGEAVPFAADISDQGAVASFVADTVTRFGQIDILVNNAGISEATTFHETSFDQWDRVMQVNLYGAIHCAREVSRIMVHRGGGGAIVNVSSIHGQRAELGASSYDVAKGGMDQLTRALAVELAPYSVRVNSVAPGFIETSMAQLNGVSEHLSQWFKDIYVGRRKIPLARPADPSEVATAILFLASDDASYITGQVLGVDGGLSVTF